MNSYHRNEVRGSGQRRMSESGQGRMSNGGQRRMSDGERRERPENFGSARSDYGDHAYGGGLNYDGSERGWWDRAADEVSSWFGDEEAERRREMDARYDGYYSDGDGNGTGSSGRRGINREPDPFNLDRPAYMSRTSWDDALAREVMTREVVRVQPGDTLQYAARLMDSYDCGALPVADRQNRLIGMITDRDIAIRGVASNRDAGSMRVADVMTDKAFACHVNDSLKNCMRSMARHQVRRMPIVSDHNRIVGIISQADIAKHAGENYGNGERKAVADVVRAVSEPSERSYR